MRGNEGGTYASTPQLSMRAFDKLPSRVRQRLAACIDDWATQPILTLVRGGMTTDYLIRLIDRWDEESREEHHYRMDRLARRGTPFFSPIRRRAPARKQGDPPGT